jgi:hypothetical protein
MSASRSDPVHAQAAAAQARGAADLPNVRRANRALAALWQTGMAPRPRLEAEVLEATALLRASRDAFGADEHWRAGLDILLRSLREEADLNALGLTMAHGQIVMALRARIRAASLWRAHPEILERPIQAPIVILGQMRSGTTRLQRLLACDDRLAHTRLHESLIPAPLGMRPGGRDGRKLRARIGIAALRRLNPEIARIHPTHATAPEEEFGLFSFSFGSAQFDAQWRVPAFTRWWEGADKTHVYREFKALLQTNAWFRGDDPGKPQMVKAPQFVEDLPVLLENFPDARFIRLDRDLAQVVPSSASLVWNQMRVQSDSADPAWIGREWLRKTLRRREIAERFFLERSDVPRIDVAYEAMNRDWRGEIERIYGFLELELTSGLLARMAAYLESARGHLGHRYSLAEFGLCEADLGRAAAGWTAGQDRA